MSHIKRTFLLEIQISLRNRILLSLAPQPSLGLGLLHKIRLNFLEASQQFSFLQGRVVIPTPTPVFIFPRGRVATHFSRLLRHAWVTVELFLFPGHHTGNEIEYLLEIFFDVANVRRNTRKNIVPK
jgi:hypothetical protein